jgi:tetratricopeptide (TPR) repeat protein
MFRRTALAVALFASAPIAGAQSASEHVAQGDREYTAMQVTEALRHYEAAVAEEPTNYEALWRAARTEVDLGEFEADKGKRTAFFKAGEDYARRAVAANPADAEGHFSLARALGRRALSLGARERVKYAGEVRAHALDALKIDPKHPGALHVMGMWNAEIMRLNGFTRMIAKKFLGGKVFGEANWKEAVRYMEEAVVVEPTRITHRLDLGQIYAEVGEKAKAREALDFAIRAPETDYNDQFYKKKAEKALTQLR